MNSIVIAYMIISFFGLIGVFFAYRERRRQQHHRP